MALTDKLTAIANAIRGKTGKTEPLTLDAMPGEIEGISTGGVSEQEIIDAIATNNYPAGDLVINSYLQPQCFTRKSKITSVILKGSIRQSESAFQACTGLKSAVVEAGDAGFAYRLFQGCTALEYVDYRIAGTASNMFNSCTALKRFEGGVNFYSIHGDGAFYKCTALKHIVLRQLTTMQGTYCFNQSSIAQGGAGCNVYVPRDLIDEQRQATNWAVYDAYGTITWKALEDYTVDGTITGAMDWAKIEAEEENA